MCVKSSITLLLRLKVFCKFIPLFTIHPLELYVANVFPFIQESNGRGSKYEAG